MRPDEDSVPMVPAVSLRRIEARCNDLVTANHWLLDELTARLDLELQRNNLEAMYEHLQTELAQALAQVRDLELQRDCLMHSLVLISREANQEHPLTVPIAYVAEAALAYCALTPAERKHDADERAALDAISLDSVEEIPY